MISGDAHMVAIDDGTNSDYADGGGGGFPVFHAGALDRSSSVKGGRTAMEPLEEEASLGCSRSMISATPCRFSGALEII
jgi:hypothetical protein